MTFTCRTGRLHLDRATVKDVENSMRMVASVCFVRHHRVRYLPTTTRKLTTVIILVNNIFAAEISGFSSESGMSASVAS